MRDELKKSLRPRYACVAQMGYQCVEFYAPYFEWSEGQTKQMRKLLDELGVRCYSTHNDEKYFSAENINRARDLNLILGTKIMAIAGLYPTQNQTWTAGRRLPTDLIPWPTRSKPPA